MLKVLIIDDIKEVSEVLLFLLQNNFSELFEEIAVANTYAEALENLEKTDYDIVFLDIELDNGKSGFDLLDEVKEELKAAVIITTAHSHYALNAIKISAIDFLLKPIDLEDLTAAIDKVKDREVNSKDVLVQFEILKEHLTSVLKTNRKIILKTQDSIKLIKTSDIIKCEAEINYTTFYLVDGRKIIVAKSLKEYSEMLEELGFFRTHKSHLINLEHLVSYEKKEGGFILMADQSKVPLSIRKKEPFFKVLASLG
ncbi:MAG: LytTR family DNA-binding domain-containing protein [Flavobacteriales bacterium]|jgi:two-component system LytT family response regulator|nr:LytTR family DNA-binding domain-containing protein [Flavobacteriales bacterium]